MNKSTLQRSDHGNVRCTLLAISAFSLLALWAGTSSMGANSLGFILLIAVAWLYFRKRICENIPDIGKQDIGYIVFGIVFCTLSGIRFSHLCINHLPILNSLIGINVTVPFLILLVVVASVLAIPFTVSFTKFMVTCFDRQESLLPECRSISSRWSTLCFLLCIAGVLSMLAMSFSYDIFRDEAFSLSLSSCSYADIVNITALDVHPPLYYFILKFVVDGVHSIFPSFHSIFVAKLVSVSVYIILLLVIATKVRRDYGNFVALLASVCLIGMSRQIDYGIEIRMYSWGMLFVTTAFLWIKNIITENKIWPWIWFVIFSLCSAYTHYFACIAAGFLYIGLLIYFWMNDRRRLWQWTIAVVLTVIGYLPWLNVLIEQLRAVSESFWIDEITLGTVWNYLVNMFACPFLLLVIVAMFVYSKTKKILPSFKEQPIAYTGMLVPIGVILVGTIVSLIMQPIFIFRYAIPAMSCLWIGLLIFVDKLDNRIIKATIAVIIVAITLVNIVYFNFSQGKYLIEAKETMAFAQANKNASFIGSAYPLMTFAALTGSNCYFTGHGDNSMLMPFDNINDVDYGKITALLTSGETVFVIIDEEIEDLPIEELLVGRDINYTFETTIRNDEHYVKVYRLSTQLQKEPRETKTLAEK